MADLSMDTAQGQFGEPTSFTGVTYRKRSGSKTAASPRPTPAPMTAHEGWEPGAWYTDADGPAGWRVPFPGALPGGLS